MILRTSVPRLIPVVLLAVTAAGCGDDAPTMPSTPTLFEKYGGAPTIAKVVDDAVVGLLADPVVAPFFAGLGQPGNSSPDRLKSCLRLQFTAVFGGPATYPGRNDRGDMCVDMIAAHRNLGITGPVFDRFITDLAGVLKADGVSDADIATVAPVLTGLKSQVVTR
ncbi:MAG: group 1 truncated hemoglobin [Vicinamibacteria bacterium]